MSNRSRLALVAAAALWSVTAPATVKNLENAYETDSGHVSLPANTGGRVVIRECAACKPVILKVNRDTRYFIGSATVPVTLDALRAEAAAKSKPARQLTVFYSLDSGFVTRIVLGAA